MTPETETTTHYFWSSSRDFRREDAQLHEMLEQGLRYAFEQQDKPMIAAQCEAIAEGEFWSMNPVILEGDAGAVRARRILRRLIHEEAQRPGVSPPGSPRPASSRPTPPES